MDADEHGIGLDGLSVMPADDLGASASEPAWLGSPADGVSIHTGFPNAAADRRLSSLDLNQLLVRNPSSTFLFRIRGEQGIMQGIFDGDIAVVDRVAAPRGQDLVLWHDGQRFNLSRPTRVAAGSVRWGTVTAVIHQYREGMHSNRK
jgi:hypothetical protein